MTEVPETPDAKEPAGPAPKKRRRWILLLVGVALLGSLVGLVGPWPVDWSSYQGSNYATATFERIAERKFRTTQGLAQAGFAKVEITPAEGEPLAGYSARDPKACDGGGDEKLYARAMTLSNGQTTVTLCGGDILLILPELRRATLDRVHLAREEVFFTASHTHSGPGGYAPGRVEQLVMGDYSQRIFDRLADAFAKAILDSRASLSAVKVVTMQVSSDLPAERSFVRNRIDPLRPAHTTVTHISAQSAGRPVCSMLIASAHPTCLSRKSHIASADYPGNITQALHDNLREGAIFAAGAVGSMGPPEDKTPSENRETAALGAMGVSSRGQAIPASAPTMPGPGDANTPRPLTLVSAIVPVDLPPVQYRITRSLRLSPVVSGLLHERRTYVHVLRVDNLVLFGVPADYSGELAMELEHWAAGQPGPAVGSGACRIAVTSFNGDYIGYVLPRGRYDLDHYEARDMNFFGPEAGPYFQDILRRIFSRVLTSAKE